MKIKCRQHPIKTLLAKAQRRRVLKKEGAG